MNKSKGVLIGCLVGILSFSTESENKPAMNSNIPAMNSSIKVAPLERFDLVQQVPSMKGFDIRARKIVVPAGVSIGTHDHLTRPGIVYVESGTIVEYRGDKSRTLIKGDSLVEDVTTVHSYKNTSTKDCILIAFDLPTSK